MCIFQASNNKTDVDSVAHVFLSCHIRIAVDLPHVFKSFKSNFSTQRAYPLAYYYTKLCSRKKNIRKITAAENDAADYAALMEECCSEVRPIGV